MTAHVPDEFRTEVASCSTEDLDNLREDARTLIERDTPAPKVKELLIDAGWSSGFADWYSTRLIAEGAAFDLVVPAKSTSSEDRALYERAVALKKSQFTTGTIMVVIATILGMIGIALLNSRGQDLTPGDVANIVVTGIVAIVIHEVLWIFGLCKILDSKGRSRAWCLLGFVSFFGYLIFFFSDHNIPRVPSKTEGHVKPDGALLSDW